MSFVFPDSLEFLESGGFVLLVLGHNALGIEGYSVHSGAKGRPNTYFIPSLCQVLCQMLLHILSNLILEFEAQNDEGTCPR